MIALFGEKPVIKRGAIFAHLREAVGRRVMTLRGEEPPPAVLLPQCRPLFRIAGVIYSDGRFQSGSVLRGVMYHAMIYEDVPKTFKPAFTVVSCFVQHEDQFVLLLRRPDKPQGSRWGVPAGKVHTDENVRVAMVRELREETGIDVVSSGLQYFSKICVRHAQCDFTYYMFSTRVNKKPMIRVSRQEHTRYRWVSPRQALSLNLVEDLDECIERFFPPEVSVAAP